MSDTTCKNLALTYQNYMQKLSSFHHLPQFQLPGNFILGNTIFFMQINNILVVNYSFK